MNIEEMCQHLKYSYDLFCDVEPSDILTQERTILTRTAMLKAAEILPVMFEFLKTVAGSAAKGRWLDADGDGDTIDGFEDEDSPPPDEDAEWEPYTQEEQTLWIESLAEQAQSLIDKVG